MTLNLFVILVAYYIIKTVREPLILAGGEHAAELKSYASGVQAFILIGYVPLYSWFSSRVPRLRLIVGLTGFFVACIQLFYVSALNDLFLDAIGFAFYVWVGIFSLSVIAQFWSYANDIAEKSVGDRLFPVIAIGATIGSPVGSAIAGVLFKLELMGPFDLLQVSAVLLMVSLGLYYWIDKRLANQPRPIDAEEPFSNAGGFRLVLSNKYLLLVAMLLILLNLVNTTGEYILSKSVTDAARAALALDPNVNIPAFIGAFYGGFFSTVNLITVVLQAFAVSRLVKFVGMKGVLLALPIISFGAYGLMAAGVGLSTLVWAKVAENSTDYSVMNTAKALLWLPTSREEKYKAKQAIDTFFVRFGDVISAGVIFLGTQYLALNARAFALMNLVVIVVWTAVALRLVKAHQDLLVEKQTHEHA